MGPGVLGTWFWLKRAGLDSEVRLAFWPLLVARATIALCFGLLGPVAIAAFGMLCAYVLRDLRGGWISAVVFGGWVGEGRNRTLGTLAMAASWTFYAATFAPAWLLEKTIHRRFASTQSNDRLLQALHRCLAVSYLLQALAASAVWWELSAR